ncbi:MAG: hypothetical protein GX587_02210 [Bacteroidales bacterium]|nr:hypothetical protein [Bacteroidales bacterium]
MNDTIINIGIYLTYVLLGICVLVALVFPLVQLVTNFSKAKTAVFGILGLAIIVVLGYLFSSTEVSEVAIKMGVGPNGVRLIGAGMITTYILMGIALLAAILSTVTKQFK